MGLLAFGNPAVSSRLDLKLPCLIDTPETIAFIASHTRPGDRIVAGPPFILASAWPEIIEGRRVLRVVPSPYFLDDFRESIFRDEIAASTEVYIGREPWFYKQLGYQIPDTVRRPIFADAEIEALDFRGVRVIVARKRK